MHRVPAVTGGVLRSIWTPTAEGNSLRSSRPFRLHRTLTQLRSCNASMRPTCQRSPARVAPKQVRQQSTDPVEEEVGQTKEKQARTPWHREGSDIPPAVRPRKVVAMTKGKLLTTPSRLLKLILPLSTLDKDTDRNDVEPLALLVHPQQPLSYLERLIQSEIPILKKENGDEKIPSVYFRAEDSQEDTIRPKAPDEKKDDTAEDLYDEIEQDEGLEETSFGGKKERTGKIHKMDYQPSSTDSASMPPPGPVEGSTPTEIPTHGGHNSFTPPESHKFIRWSPSTEIGDFIRDAARSKEFAVEIEGQKEQVLVSVPSFNDRTHYIRLRLRKTADKILDMAAIKHECDMTAHRGAQRVAVGGAGLLVGYWYVVYRLTFETDLGWDVMEPVTYLVGLSCLIGGYLWFLYHNREVSYRAAMNLTISKRRAKLYESKGFDLNEWEGLIEEANTYRNEIKAIAREYDVHWDEKEDEKDERVVRAMKRMRRAKEDKKGEKEEGED